MNALSRSIRRSSFACIGSHAHKPPLNTAAILRATFNLQQRSRNSDHSKVRITHSQDLVDPSVAHEDVKNDTPACGSTAKHSSIPRKSVAWDKPKFWLEFEDSYKCSDANEFPSEEFPVNWLKSKKVVAEGQLQKIVILSKDMTFAHIKTRNAEIQLICHKSAAVNDILKEIAIGSAIRVTGTLQRRVAPKKKGLPQNTTSNPATQAHSTALDETKISPRDAEIVLDRVVCINSFQSGTSGNPNDPSISHPPQNRHLQIRFDSELAKRLKFRSEVAKAIRNHLSDFQEVETPILFKSTPEGAREFLVPTRRKGFAYALPQSPQQYKQMLIASGISNYFQFAKCFRDEDMRADRQPEFTQIDFEMSWSDGKDVRKVIENLVRSIYQLFKDNSTMAGRLVSGKMFPVITYHEAMTQYGSDKPDFRIDGKIATVHHITPSGLKSMISSVEDPEIDAWRFRSGATPREVRSFISTFLDSPAAADFNKNPDGAPALCIYDSRAPLEGLQAYGHESAEKLKIFWEEHEGEFEDGDLLILQARKDPFLHGGSTVLGRLRLAINKAAIEAGLVEQKDGHHYLWVTKFPMFTPNDGVDPGQGGTAGFSATHHPFTAPYSLEDIELLRSEPLQAKADHYDLVVNGVELGGGSRRVQSAEMQKYIMRDILQMSEERMNDFSHLFDALAAGCPPHAGFAIGFDRMIAVLTGRDSVKDVIAFPKSSKGEDLTVRSPSLMTQQALDTYHLNLNGDESIVGEGEPVKEAEDKTVVGGTPSTS